MASSSLRFPNSLIELADQCGHQEEASERCSHCSKTFCQKCHIFHVETLKCEARNLAGDLIERYQKALNDFPDRKSTAIAALNKNVTEITEEIHKQADFYVDLINSQREKLLSSVNTHKAAEMTRLDNVKIPFLEDQDALMKRVNELPAFSTFHCPEMRERVVALCSEISRCDSELLKSSAQLTTVNRLKFYDNECGRKIFIKAIEKLLQVVYEKDGATSTQSNDVEGGSQVPTPPKTPEVTPKRPRLQLAGGAGKRTANDLEVISLDDESVKDVVEPNIRQSNKTDSQVVTDTPEIDLKEAILSKNLEKAVCLLKANPHLYIPKKLNFKRTALMLACETGFVELARLLLEEFNVDWKQQLDRRYQALGTFSRRPTNMSCLHLAVEKHQLEVVRYLAEKFGAEMLEHRDRDGYTALHFAAEKGDIPAVEILVRAGANVSNRCHPGQQTPLIDAANKGHLSVVKFLVENKADVSDTDKDGCSAIHVASISGHLDVIKFLLEVNPDLIRKTTPEGDTPIHCTILSTENDDEKKIEKIVAYFVEKLSRLKNDVRLQVLNGRGYGGLTTLGVARKKGYKSIAELLIKNGAK